MFKTTLATVPAQITYLSPGPKKQDEWRVRLGPKARERVGLVWAGNPRHRNDHNRSIPLEDLSTLLGLEFEFHCLQKEIKAQDKERLSRDFLVRTHVDELKDFVDTAALIRELDLVVTVDTSVAHLAGALGSPVWILIPFNPDFRWMTDGESSPWYPTARLFRQSKLGDWSDVVTRVVAELKNIPMS